MSDSTQYTPPSALIRQSVEKKLGPDATPEEVFDAWDYAMEFIFG